MSKRTCFVCNDLSKLKELGFKEKDDSYVYYSNGQHRIWVYKKNNMISFVHHSFDSYNKFKEMIELSIIEIKTIDTCTKDTKIEMLEKRILELESRLLANDKC